MKASSSYIRLYLVFSIISFCACSQDTAFVPQVLFYQQRLGESTFQFRHLSYKKEKPVLFLHLHHNEITAGQIADSMSMLTGIEFLQLLNNGKRLLHFAINQRSYRVDPNRIFSRAGAIASLERLSKSDDEALAAIDSLQIFLTSFFDKDKLVVALHNNTDGDFSVEDYQQNGTGTVYRNPVHDPDDFFITTDNTIFSKLKDKGFNVVLEDISTIADDGSLSIYCAKKGIRYVNIEAQHGHYREQWIMLEELLKTIEE